ncbi:MAG: YraN family protein [Gammaproteobacteria bacterium]
MSSQPPIPSRTIGQTMEDQACHYLLKHGLSLLQRNYTCRMGEIDLIMQQGNCMVFVEVRYRRVARFGHSLETVDRKKQQKLLKTAQYYLLCHPNYQKLPCRFDVVAFSRNASQLLEIIWVKQAF